MSLSTELQKAKEYLLLSKDVINNKYEIQGTPQLSTLLQSGLPGAINAIKAYNLKDCTATPEDIRIGKTAYSFDEFITGVLKEHEGIFEEYFHDATIPNFTVDLETKPDWVTLHYTKDNDEEFIIPQHLDYTLYFNIEDIARLLGVKIQDELEIRLTKQIPGDDDGSDTEGIPRLDVTYEAGYYKKIHAYYDDWELVQVINVPGEHAHKKTIRYGDSFVIDPHECIFNEDYEVLGWSLDPRAEEPDYMSNQELGPFQLHRDLANNPHLRNVYQSNDELEPYDLLSIRADTKLLYAVCEPIKDPLELVFTPNPQRLTNGKATVTGTISGGHRKNKDKKSLVVTGVDDADIQLNAQNGICNLYKVTVNKPGVYTGIASEIRCADAIASFEVLKQNLKLVFTPASTNLDINTGKAIVTANITGGGSDDPKSLLVLGEEVGLSISINPNNEIGAAVQYAVEVEVPGTYNGTASEEGCDDAVSKFVVGPPQVKDSKSGDFIQAQDGNPVRQRNPNITSKTLDYVHSYDSGWVPDHYTNGCYIDSYKFSVSPVGGHSNNYDSMYILGKKSSGEIVIIADRFKSVSGVSYSDHYKNCGIGNLNSNRILQGNNLTESNDIRQIRFITCVRTEKASDHATCVDPNKSNITYSYTMAYTKALLGNTDTQQSTPDDGCLYELAGTGGTGSSPTDPINPIDPTPTDPTSTEPSTNFSTDAPDMQYMHGYNEIKGTPKYVEAYKRFYNAFNLNGSQSTYSYTDFTDGCSITGVSSIQNGKLYIELEDLSITWGEAWYISNIVKHDYPELMAKFDAPAVSDNTSNKVLYALFDYYNESTRQSYISTINSTFSQICTQIQNTYGITYDTSKSYNDKNKYYTEAQKKQIAKVIHDWLEVKNEYGNAETGDSINQTLYPAMACKNIAGNASGPVCASYAAAFYYCCKKWGIAAITVVGGAGTERDGRHAWNMVNYKSVTAADSGYNNGSDWQEVDCTWDDGADSSVETNVPLNNGSYTIDMQVTGSICNWIYFNTSTSEINNGTINASTSYAYSGSGRNKFPTNVSKAVSFTVNAYKANPNASYYNNDPTTKRYNIEGYANYPTGTCISNKYKNGSVPLYALQQKTYTVTRCVPAWSAGNADLSTQITNAQKMNDACVGGQLYGGM